MAVVNGVRDAAEEVGPFKLTLEHVQLGRSVSWVVSVLDKYEGIKLYSATVESLDIDKVTDIIVSIHRAEEEATNAFKKYVEAARAAVEQKLIQAPIAGGQLFLSPVLDPKANKISFALVASCGDYVILLATYDPERVFKSAIGGPDELRRVITEHAERAAKNLRVRCLKELVTPPAAQPAAEGNQAPQQPAAPQPSAPLKKTLRGVIVSIIRKTGRPMSAAEIIDELEKMDVAAARGTIYSTLWLMAKDGELVRTPTHLYATPEMNVSLEQVDPFLAKVVDIVNKYGPIRPVDVWKRLNNELGSNVRYHTVYVTLRKAAREGLIAATGNGLYVPSRQQGL